ncbi:hypothetical protein ACSRUE_06820 [Sorangium sp. KYC3313]|uniref:hypothetical protein n=1 Tax=Sorangium sp. KYC3313 TaxID=3449740 RepID=UPI003F8B30C0
MRISIAQRAMFEREVDVQSTLRVIAHLCAFHASAIRGTTPPGPFWPHVRAGMARARSHGIRAEWAVTSFVAMMFEIGPDFDTQPEIRAFLEEGSGLPEMRLMEAVERAPEESWTDAEENADPGAWAIPDDWAEDDPAPAAWAGVSTDRIEDP